MSLTLVAELSLCHFYSDKLIFALIYVFTELICIKCILTEMFLNGTQEKFYNIFSTSAKFRLRALFDVKLVRNTRSL